MDNPNLYKLYQVSNVFISKYDYIQFVLKTNNNSSNEAWLTNYTNPNYQVIRVSFDYGCNSDKEKVLETLLNYFKKDSKLEDIKFLDIHITNFGYDKDNEKFDHINIDEGYYDGIDLHNLYPEIYGCIHPVENPDSEITSVLNKAKEKLHEKLKQLPFLKRYAYLFTYITIGICTLMYLITFILSMKYDSTSVFLLLGADYKILTLGCHEYYRLITYAFLHSSIIHLFCNMVSLLSLGRYVESRFGHLKFLIILFISIICGSLTQGILTDNGLCIGMSGGIYGLFIVFLIDTVSSRVIDLRRFMPTLILNISLNFMTTVAWMCHLGGAIAGLACYMAFSKKKNYLGFIVLAILIIGLFTKYLSIDSIETLYGGTDSDYLSLLNELNLNASKMYTKILNAYTKYGG